MCIIFFLMIKKCSNGRQSSQDRRAAKPGGTGGDNCGGGAITSVSPFLGAIAMALIDFYKKKTISPNFARSAQFNGQGEPAQESPPQHPQRQQAISRQVDKEEDSDSLHLQQKLPSRQQHTQSSSLFAIRRQAEQTESLG
jgi:flagellar motor protein MotB